MVLQTSTLTKVLQATAKKRAPAGARNQDYEVIGYFFAKGVGRGVVSLDGGRIGIVKFG